MTNDSLQVTIDLQTLFNEAAAQRADHHVPKFDPDANWYALWTQAEDAYEQFLATLKQWEEEGYNAVVASAPFANRGAVANEYDKTHLEQFQKGRLQPVKLEL